MQVQREQREAAKDRQHAKTGVKENPDVGVSQFRHYMLPIFLFVWKARPYAWHRAHCRPDLTMLWCKRSAAPAWLQIGVMIFPFCPIIWPGGYIYRFIQPMEETPDEFEDPDFINGVCDLMQNQRVCTMFNASDTDGSGAITIDELANVVTMLQLAEDNHSLDSMMKSLDLDHVSAPDPNWIPVPAAPTARAHRATLHGRAAQPLCCRLHEHVAYVTLSLHCRYIAVT